MINNNTMVKQKIEIYTDKKETVKDLVTARKKHDKIMTDSNTSRIDWDKTGKVFKNGKLVGEFSTTDGEFKLLGRKPKCENCKVSKDVVVAFYGDLNWVGYECENCSSVVKAVFDIKN